LIQVGGGTLAVAILTAPGAFAAEPAGAVTDVLSCSRLSDPAARLACFDSAATALQRGASPPSGVAPRAAATPAAPATPPPAAAFARPAAPVERPPQIKRAAAALQMIETGPDGRMLVTLEDGSVWRQIDDRRLASIPQSGTPAEVRRGMWGAYFIDFEGQREIRAERIR
jgi:glucose/arabinose dehydrogenase